jgi:hypothetical protein
MVVSLASDSLHGRPKSVLRLKVLSPVELGALPAYDGPTWLDRTLVDKQRSPGAVTGFGAELGKALEDRRRWLAANTFTELRPSGEWVPKPRMIGRAASPGARTDRARSLSSAQRVLRPE